VSPLGDSACPVFPHRLRACLLGDVIICAVLAVLSAVPIPRSHSESRTPRCGRLSYIGRVLGKEHWIIVSKGNGPTSESLRHECNMFR
jgi:hypothetical protein